MFRDERLRTNGENIMTTLSELEVKLLKAATPYPATGNSYEVTSALWHLLRLGLVTKEQHGFANWQYVRTEKGNDELARRTAGASD